MLCQEKKAGAATWNYYTLQRVSSPLCHFIPAQQQSDFSGLCCSRWGLVLEGAQQTCPKGSMAVCFNLPGVLLKHRAGLYFSQRRTSSRHRGMCMGSDCQINKLRHPREEYQLWQTEDTPISPEWQAGEWDAFKNKVFKAFTISWESRSSVCIYEGVRAQKRPEKALNAHLWLHFKLWASRKWRCRQNYPAEGWRHAPTEPS